MKHSSLDLANQFNLDHIGNEKLIEHLGLCNRSNLQPHTLSYVANADYLQEALNNDCVEAIILPHGVYESTLVTTKTLLLCEYPEEKFYEIHQSLYASQLIDASKPHIGQQCNIHPSAIIEENVIIGNGVTIGAYSIIHRGTRVGNNTIISSHCSIGSNGFQALKDHEGKSYNVAHMGGVVIGNNCYISEYVNIVRGLFDNDVIIGNHVLIDAYCHIAHDCFIGDNSVLTVSVKMFGSSAIGNNVWMSPGSMVMNRIKVADNCHVTPYSFVMSKTEQGETYIGNPAIKKCSYITRQVKLKKLLKQ